MRGISTVVDTTVFLLLLGGAVATLVAGTGGFHPPDRADDPADDTATLIATTTTTVDYELTPTGTERDGVDYSGTGGSFDRTAHGTTVGLLAAATVSSSTLDSERLAPASGGFERAVGNETQSVIRRPGTVVAVTASWEPYDGAPVANRLHVGPEPPARVDVRAAQLTVDSGVEPVHEQAVAAAREHGWDGVARIVASSVVTGVFPPDETRVALRGDAPVDTLTAHRYRRVARLTDVPLLAIGTDSVETMNAQLVDGLTGRLSADMRRRFETPEAAARTVATGKVKVVVRTWSP